MTIKAHINETLIAAMKAKEMDKVKVLRGVQAAIKQIEIDKQITLDDAATLELLQKQLKQRQESLAIYQENGRADLADKEQFEIDVINQFMPALLSVEELTAIVKATIDELGATSIKEMGKVMNAVKTKTAGQADPAQIATLIKANLS